MNIFNKIIRLLEKPFPDEESSWGYVKNLVILSLFIALFLFIFQPFGISTLESNTFLICLGFGSMTFTGAILYELSIGSLLSRLGLRANWTFIKWILYTLGAMLFISIANFMYARLLLFGYIQWELFPHMLYGTFMIGIIPISVYGGIKMMNHEKKYRIIADEINQQKSKITRIVSENSLSIFDVPASRIKYVESLQNYIKIGFVDAEGQWTVQTERATLKFVSDQVKGSSIIKCHRSYLVNKDAIISASGNAQGLLLSLSECEKTIPVSRTFVPDFRNDSIT